MTLLTQLVHHFSLFAQRKTKQKERAPCRLDFLFVYCKISGDAKLVTVPAAAYSYSGVAGCRKLHPDILGRTNEKKSSGRDRKERFSESSFYNQSSVFRLPCSVVPSLPRFLASSFLSVLPVAIFPVSL